MKKRNQSQSHGSIRKLKAYGAVGVLSIGMITVTGNTTAFAEENAAAPTTEVVTNATTPQVTTAQVEQAQAEVDAAQTTLYQVTSAVATAEQTVAAAQAEADTAMTAVADHKAQIVQAQEIVASNPSVEEATAQITEAQSSVTSTQNQVAETTNQISNLQNEFATAQALVDKATQTVASETKAVEQAQAQLNQDKADQATVQTAVSTAQAQVDTAKATVATKEAAVGTAQAAVTEAQTKVAAIEKSNDTSTLSEAERQANIVKAEAELKTVQENAEAARVKIVEAKASIKEAQTAVMKAEQAVKDAELVRDSMFKVNLSEAYKENLFKFYEARYVNNDNEEMHRIWDILKAESDRLLDDDTANRVLTKLSNALKQIESNNRVVIKANTGGLNTLTKADRLELTQFAQNIINDIRDQMGITSKVVITEGSLEVADLVAKEYLKDDWNAVLKGHNKQAMLRVIDSTGQRIEENLSPKQHVYSSDFTMVDLKSSIAQSLQHMMLYDYSNEQHFGHAMSLAGLDSKYYEKEKGYQYLGVSGYTASTTSGVLYEMSDHGVVSPFIAGPLIPNPVTKESLEIETVKVRTKAIERLKVAKEALVEAEANLKKANDNYDSARSLINPAWDKLTKARIAKVQPASDSKALELAKATLAQAEAKLATAKTELATAKADLTKKEQALATVQNTLRFANTDVATSQASLTTQQNDLKAAQTAFTQAQNTLTSKQSALTAAHNRLAALNKALTAAKAKVTAAQNTLKTVQGYANTFAKLQGELKPLLATQAEAQTKLDSAKAKLATLNLEKQVAQANYNTALANLKNLQAQYEAYQAYLTAQAEAERLERERIEAEKKAEDARKKAEADAQAKAEADRLAAEAKAKAEAERLAKEQAEKARLEAEKKAKEEAAAKAEEEAKRLAEEIKKAEEEPLVIAKGESTYLELPTFDIDAFIKELQSKGDGPEQSENTEVETNQPDETATEEPLVTAKGDSTYLELPEFGIDAFVKELNNRQQQSDKVEASVALTSVVRPITSSTLKTDVIALPVANSATNESATEEAVNYSRSEKTKILPETGSENNWLLSVVGVGLASLGLAIVYRKKLGDM
ncbi:TPA: SEC10/PgrA surface exclusion domain-containing protein [Streptococcus suis]